MTGFEETYLEIQRLGNEYFFKNLPELEEQLIELRNIKSNLNEMISIREMKGYDVLHIDDVRNLLTKTTDGELL